MPPPGSFGPPWLPPPGHLPGMPHMPFPGMPPLPLHPPLPPVSPAPGSDLKTLETLGASEKVADSLTAAAALARDAFEAEGLDEEHYVLYGSLALMRTECVPDGHPPQLSQLLSKHGVKEVRTSYITNRSDVDFAVYLPDPQRASSIVNRILKLGQEDGWQREQATVVPRFDVSQWTLVNENGVRLDLTFFFDRAQYERFEERQHNFREIFWSCRHFMHTAYGPSGIVAFDAYIYVLKAFAAYVSRTAFTSFQAVCLGLFVLQHSQSQRMVLVPSGNWLFNHFLHFCLAFFDTGKPRKGSGRFPRHTGTALDISRGRMIRRVGQRSRAELYFTVAEERCGADVTEWQNVLHNSDPEAICEAAQSALKDWFGSSPGTQDTTKLSRDLVPAMTTPKPR